MDLTQLANLGEFIGGIAVLVTLVYLAVQVRQNTRSLRTAAISASNTRSSEISFFIAGNPECLHAFRVGLEDPNALEDEDEKVRFILLMNGWARHLHDLFFQYRIGSLTPEDWEGYLFNIRELAATSGFRAFWVNRRGAYSAPFVDLIDREISDARESPLPSSLSLIVDPAADGGNSLSSLSRRG